MSEILEIMDQVPSVVWVLLVLYLLFRVLRKSGDRKIWGYEVEFPLTEGVGRAEVEIESWEKRGKTIELELRPVEQFSFSDVKILVDGYGAFSAKSGEFNKWNKCEKEYSFDQPKEGAEVKVLFDNKEVFSGALLID